MKQNIKQSADCVYVQAKDGAGSTNGRPVLRNIDWTLATDKPSVSAKSVKFLYRKKGSFIIQKMDKKNLIKSINVL